MNARRSSAPLDVPQLRYLLGDAQREPLPEAEPDNLVSLLFAT